MWGMVWIKYERIWLVGRYQDGQWQTRTRHTSRAAAQRHVAYLNREQVVRPPTGEEARRPHE